MSYLFKTNTLRLTDQKITSTGNMIYVNDLALGSGTLTNLVTTGVTLHNEIIGLSGVLIQSGGILHNEIVGLSGTSLGIAFTGQFGASGNLTQTGITLHNEIVGLSGKLNESGDLSC
jgi:hypothetical protein